MGSECDLIDTVPSGRYTIFMEKDAISLATRAKLLDAASKVITRSGTDALTLDAVAQEAGVSKGGLLYHFPSKKQLIRGMVERLIAQVDEALQDELDKSGGDYVTAYIRASFRTQAAPDQVSQALSAAVSSDPELIRPLRERFFRMQQEIATAAGSEELGTIIRLALDGLWMSDVFGFAPPSAELREKMLPALLEIARKHRRKEP